MRTRSEGSIATFLAITAVLSSVFYSLVIAAGHVNAGAGLYVTGLMWCPGVAAFSTVVWRRIDPRSLGLAWGGLRYALTGYALPLIYSTLAYLPIWLLGFGSFPSSKAIASLSDHFGWQIANPAIFVVTYFALVATTELLMTLALALGEEIGWRGFLAPRLIERFGFCGGALVTGAIWTVWHLPIVLFADYNLGTPIVFALPCFLILGLSLSVILAWLRLRSNSVWPCAFLHASHNLFIQNFFTPLTGERGEFTRYLIDEFGAVLPAVISCIALVIWFRQRRTGRFGALAVPSPHSNPATQSTST